MSVNEAIKCKRLDYLRLVRLSSPLLIHIAFSIGFTLLSKIRSFWLPVHLYKGISKEGGHSITFTYLGWDAKMLNYWLSRIFDDYEKLLYKKLIPVWHISKYAEKNPYKSDLAIVELTNKLAANGLSDVNGFILPRWLKMYLNVDLSSSLLEKKRNQIQRRISKYSLELETGSTNQDFIFFYERMYKPYIKLRHKESAVVEDFQKMFYDFKKEKSTIYFVTRNGVRIAGLYEQCFNGIPYMHAVGVLDGSDDIMRMGAIGATYSFAIAHHKRNNIKRVNLGGTSPLLKDGLTRFKLSIGAMVSEIQLQDSIRVKLLPLMNSPAVKYFLTSNSFTYIDNKDVNCAIFKDDSVEKLEKEFQKILQQTNALSINKAKVFCFDSNNKFSEYVSPFNKAV